MKKVCEFFSIVDEVELIDGEGNIVTIPASSEIKGIRSSNKKKYILDLMRLSPRDLNWIDTDDSGNNLCCVCRPELISYYLNSKALQTASQLAKAELEQKKDTDPDKKSGDLETGYSYSEYVNKIQEFLMKDTTKSTIKFNPNIHTRVKLVKTPKIEGNKKLRFF